MKPGAQRSKLRVASIQDIEPLQGVTEARYSGELKWRA